MKYMGNRKFSATPQEWEAIYQDATRRIAEKQRHGSFDPPRNPSDPTGVITDCYGLLGEWATKTVLGLPIHRDTFALGGDEGYDILWRDRWKISVKTVATYTHRLYEYPSEWYARRKKRKQKHPEFYCDLYVCCHIVPNTERQVRVTGWADRDVFRAEKRKFIVQSTGDPLWLLDNRHLMSMRELPKWAASKEVEQGELL